MVKGLIGKKLGMTRIFNQDGAIIPVTVIQAGPCTVVQKKTQDRDGYEAVQLGFGSKKKVNRPMAGHFKTAGDKKFAVIKEFPVENLEGFEPGTEVTAGIFSVGEKINVSGTSKGRGFTGVIKRHGFSGGRTTHGCTTHRSPGSIGSAADPSRTFPGKRMAGHMGAGNTTVRNLEVIDIRPEYGIILVKGAIPGPNQSVVILRKK